MKILFSNPPWWSKDETDGTLRAGIRAGSRWPFTTRVRSTPDNFIMGDYLPYPFFMGYAAAYARKHFVGTHVEFRDSIARRESYQTYLDYLHIHTPDFIIVESATPSWKHDSHVIGLIEQASPKSQVIVTGTLTSTKSEEILKAHPNVIACVKGEYEKGVAEVLKGARGIIQHMMLTKEEMNEAPIPMMDEVCALHYWDACPAGQLQPQAQIWSSRGCPFRCCFCAWPAVMTGNDPDGTGKRSVRHYTPEYMERYIRTIITQYGYKCIYFDDDTFNLTNKHTLAMCEVMGRIGLPWSAMCRGDTIELETWQIMHDSGCKGVKVGMESGSQSVIDGIINKRLNLEHIEKVVLPAIIKTGMTVHTTWTVGLPGETRAQQQETVDMITRLYNAGLHHTHQLSGTAEIEGTPLATLSAMGKDGHLTAYPDAKMDGYDHDGDGQAKIERMARSPLALK